MCVPECGLIYLSAVPEEGSRFPGTGVIGSCELPHVGAGNQTLGFCKSSLGS